MLVSYLRKKISEIYLRLPDCYAKDTASTRTSPRPVVRSNVTVFLPSGDSYQARMNCKMNGDTVADAHGNSATGCQEGGSEQTPISSFLEGPKPKPPATFFF